MLIALVLNRLPLAAALATWGLPLAPGTPVAVGPPPLGEPRVGIASAGAEASGVRHGMLLGEALTLCPSLVLVPPDPAGVQARAAKLISDIDALGLPVEEIAPGRALIDAAPGLRLHGGLQRLIQRLLDIGRSPCPPTPMRNCCGLRFGDTRAPANTVIGRGRRYLFDDLQGT